MVKETGHHQPKGKKPLTYNGDGLHAADLMETALDHPFWFSVVCFMINHNFPEKWTIALLRRIV